MKLELTVNDQTVSAEIEPRLTLLDFLRDELRLTGTHAGCEHGVCGACSVLLENNAVRSCLMFAAQAGGANITTIEGLQADDGALSYLQDAFWEKHGLQCGYCTPGMIVAAHSLLLENPDPDEQAIRDAIEGNLCRCTGYVQIVEAITLAARNMRDAGDGS